MTDEILKPCAHCNSIDIRMFAQPYFGNDVLKVMCWGCGMQTQYRPNRESIDKWNQRA